MKKNLLLIVIVCMALLFSSCNRVEEIDYSNLLIGKWLNTYVNDIPVMTDKSFYMELTTDGKQNFAQGQSINANEIEWRESTASYSIKDNIVTITGPNSFNEEIYLVMEITKITNEYFTYGVRELRINGVLIEDNKIYTMEKVTNDYSSAIVGLWFGKETTVGVEGAEYHYWEYLADGSYNYYSWDAEQNQWIVKEDNNGRYFLYGDLLASNFTNSDFELTPGRTYECWAVSISGDEMEWSGIRENNALVKFNLERVSQIQNQ